MDTEGLNQIPVNIDRPTEQNAKIVYVIPAKPKPKESWYKGLIAWAILYAVFIGSCLICGR